MKAKPISQKQARRLQAEYTILLAAAKREDAIKEAVIAERDAALKDAATLRGRLAALKYRLDKPVRVAEWKGAPDEVRTAIAVAAHLGHALVFTIEKPERGYPYVPYEAEGSALPESLEYVVVHAYRQVAA